MPDCNTHGANTAKENTASETEAAIGRGPWAWMDMDE